MPACCGRRSRPPAKPLPALFRKRRTRLWNSQSDWRRCRSDSGGCDARRAMRDRTLDSLQEGGFRGFGCVTVILDGAEILKRLPRAVSKPTAHIVDCFHIAMEIQAQSQSGSIEVLPTVDRDTRAVKRHLWHGRNQRYGTIVCDLERSRMIACCPIGNQPPPRLGSSSRRRSRWSPGTAAATP